MIPKRLTLVLLLVQAVITLQAQPGNLLKKTGQNPPPPPAVPLPPPPPVLTLTGELPKEQRGLLVLSAGLVTWSGVEKLNPVYDFLQKSGAESARKQLAGHYGKVVVLEGKQGTVAQFYAELGSLAANFQAVDVIIHSHGSPNELLFEDGRFSVSRLAAAAVNGGSVDVVSPDTGKTNKPSLRLNAMPKQHREHLRMVYETACFGASHIDGWLQMGFATAAGCHAVHSDSPASFPTFLNWWSAGYNFGDCVAAANRADANQSYDKWLKQTDAFKDSTVDSQRVVRGKTSASLSDGQPVTPSTIVNAGREFAANAKSRVDQKVSDLAQGKFDEDVLGFHVKLEDGSATTASQKTTLSGTVSVWPVANPGTRLSFLNATFTVVKSGNTAVSFGGNGKLTASVQGQNVALGDAATAVCSAQGQLTGNGKLQAQNHTFNVSYNLAASGLSADGNWNGGDSGWHDVPAISGAEYHVQNPRLTVELRNAAITAKFCCTQVEARTKGRNSVNNQPWASSQISPPCVSAGVNGNIDLPIRPMPEPGDVNLSARNVCKAACAALPSGEKPVLPNWPGDRPKFPGPARDAYDALKSVYDNAKSALDEWNRKVDAHNKCVDGCDGKFPKPPTIPRLPTSISIKVEVVIR